MTLTLGNRRTTPPRPDIYPQNLSTEYLVVWGSKKQQKRSGIIQTQQKGEAFSVS